MISFFVPGDPTPKGRPRATTKAARGIKLTKYGPIIARAKPRLYTPENTIEGEERVRAAFLKKYRVDPSSGPLRLEITAFFRPPNAAIRAAMERGHVFVERRPDGDNLIKLVMDALEGLAYHNDWQIVSWHGKKIYGNPEGVLVVVNSINEIGGKT
jgi:Holliday junction resolvase RusA-like endonuclease